MNKDFIQRYSEIIESRIGLNHSTYESLNSFYSELSDLILKSSEEDMILSVNILLDCMNRISSIFPDISDSKPLSSILSTLLQLNKPSVLAVLSNDIVLKTFKKKNMGFAENYNNSSNLYRGFANLIIYNRRINDYQKIDFILSLIPRTNLPFILLEFLKENKSKIPKNKNLYQILRIHINTVSDPDTHAKLELMLEWATKTPTEIKTDSKRIISEQLAVLEKVSLFKTPETFFFQANKIIGRNFQLMETICKYIYIRYAPDTLNKDQSLSVFLAIRKIILSLQKNRKIYEFITTFPDIIVYALKKYNPLDYSQEDYLTSETPVNYQFKFLSLAIDNNNSQLLDSYLHSLSQNKFVLTLDSTYKLIAFEYLAYGKIINESMMNIIKKWIDYLDPIYRKEFIFFIEPNEIQLEKCLSYISAFQIMEGDYLERRDDESIFIQTVNEYWQLMRKKPDHLLLILDALFKKVDVYKKKITSKYESSIHYISSFEMEIRDTSIRILSVLFENFDCRTICKMIFSNLVLSANISDLFAENEITYQNSMPWEFEVMLEKKYVEKQFLDDESFLEFGKLLTNMQDRDLTIYEVVDRLLFVPDNLNINILRIRLSLLNIWNSKDHRCVSNKSKSLLIYKILQNQSSGKWRFLSGNFYNCILYSILSIFPTDPHLASELVSDVLPLIENKKRALDSFFTLMDISDFIAFVMSNELLLNILISTIKGYQTFQQTVYKLIQKESYFYIDSIISYAIEDSAVSEEDICTILIKTINKLWKENVLTQDNLSYLHSLSGKLSSTIFRDKLKNSLDIYTERIN
ncbi:MAG: hypothetical protein GX933_00585 [Chloroflexi bacterium]|nr:hypothetical protein [Chloroflexota bacterium]